MRSATIILITLFILSGFLSKSYSQIFIGTTEIDTNSIVTGLDTPWEILWGPDDHIWLTERNGTISRLNPESGELAELISIGDVIENNEGGLLGMVLHPDFENYPHVFVVYTYVGSSGVEEKLVRYTYSNGELASPLTLLEGIDGFGNHNGSRLVIDAEQKLYMTTGDAGNTAHSQNLNSLNGKVLRMNLDGSFPEDNPFQGSYVWSWGHRNAQGLVLSPLGLMYSSEHGTSRDDEVNIIEKGRNYGWPEVQGFCDDPAETQFCANANVAEPIVAWTPTLAVAGTDFYSHSAIPEWQNSLLVTTLKEGSLAVLKLSPDGRSVISEELLFDYWWGRLRDICISPDGRVFLAVSNRDGRGTVLTGDDRIVEILSLNDAEYCSREESVSICPGETFNFYGQELGQPGIYSDTISNTSGCDTIVSLLLNFYDLVSLDLVDSVLMAHDDEAVLTVNEGFISYEWNADPALDENTITVLASELGEGIFYYTIEVVDSNACIQYDTSVVIVSPAVGIQSLAKLEYSVYPNPVSGAELNIDYNISAEGTLIIYSQDGREVSRYTLASENQHIQIQLPETRGIYNLILRNKEGLRHMKILKL